MEEQNDKAEALARKIEEIHEFAQAASKEVFRRSGVEEELKKIRDAAESAIASTAKQRWLKRSPIWLIVRC